MELSRRSFFKGLFAVAVKLHLPDPVIEWIDPGPQYLIRSEIWSRQIKEILLNELVAMKFTKILEDDESSS